MTTPWQVPCPCCLFPTLSCRGYYEICIICWWEDDGQDDRDAGKVVGGPNSQYSLTDARKNFADHGHMYDSGQGIEVVGRPSATRKELLDYLQSIGFDPRRADVVRLGELLSTEDRHLQNDCR